MGWARSLLADLMGHWEKRNREALSNYDPRNLRSRACSRELYHRYGGKLFRKA